MIFCHKCGSEQLEGSEFCRKCGARLIAEDDNQTTESTVHTELVKENVLYTNTAYTANNMIEDMTNEIPIYAKRSNTRIIVLIVVCVLILTVAGVIIAFIISNSNSDDTKGSVTYYENSDSTDEVSEIIEDYFNSDNKYLLMVKNAHRKTKPGITYEEAFENFFTDPRWEYYKSTEGQDVVEFTGGCTYRDSSVKARLQFIVNEDKGTFETHFLSFNEVPQDLFTIASLIETVFGEDDDDVNINTYSDYFTDSELYSIAQSLGVPDNLDITFDVSEPHYWDGGDCKLCYVAVKYNGKTVAGAEYEVGNASEPVKSISRY